MAEEEGEAMGIEGGGIESTSGSGVRLDGATYMAACDEVKAAGFVPPGWTSGAALILGGLRTGQKIVVPQIRFPMVESVAQYLASRGEHALALKALVDVVW